MTVIDVTVDTMTLCSGVRCSLRWSTRASSSGWSRCWRTTTRCLTTRSSTPSHSSWTCVSEPQVSSESHTDHYTLTITHWPLHTDHYTLTTTHWPLHTEHYTLTTTHWPLHTDHYTLTITHWPLHTDHYTLEYSVALLMNLCLRTAGE